ncbi:MAG: helix-hairpin-helix domain-containing protein, partial [Candidatus Diapherotrites archaeon]|nr:helix-hairpin-helix domain-containing protein [Candidatus Diapherotrites archaeon]
RAYRAAANAIESLGKPVEQIYMQGGLKALEEIPGVGEALAKKIEEMVKTGKLKHYDKLKKSLPINLDELETVPGLGPKKLMVLYKELGIKNLKDLKKPAEQHKIAGLRGFAEKSEQEILKAVAANGVKSERIPLSVALPVAKEIVERLRKLKEAERVEAAGSLRRRRPTIGDIDILVASEKPNVVSKVFVSMPSVKKVLGSGETKSSGVLSNGMQSDLRVVKPEQWGSALQYFTGSKAHSIALRKIAMKKGLKLSEYGVFKGSKVIASKTEEDVYNAIGLDYIKPELRENEGEIEAALASFKKRLCTKRD